MLTFSVKMFYLIKGLKNFKAGGQSECQFPATYMAFLEISHSRFKQSKELSAQSMLWGVL